MGAKNLQGMYRLTWKPLGSTMCLSSLLHTLRNICKSSREASFEERKEWDDLPKRIAVIVQQLPHFWYPGFRPKFELRYPPRGFLESATAQKLTGTSRSES